MPGYDRVRAKLEERLELLTRRLRMIEGDLQRPGDPDSEERAIELENDEVLEGLGESGQNEVRGIRAALGRIEAGTFGICTRCGEEIAAGRLEALPFTNVCVGCAK